MHNIISRFINLDNSNDKWINIRSLTTSAVNTTSLTPDCSVTSSVLSNCIDNRRSSLSSTVIADVDRFFAFGWLDSIEMHEKRAIPLLFFYICAKDKDLVEITLTSDVVHWNWDCVDSIFIWFDCNEQKRRNRTRPIAVANRLVNEIAHERRSPRNATFGDTIGVDKIANGHVGTMRIGNLKRYTHVRERRSPYTW